MGALGDALKRVARGERLSREESRAAFSSILTEDETELAAAALLGAMASRGETADELAGVVDVLLACVTPPPVERELAMLALDVCGTGGDGLGTFNVSTATAFVVAGAGVPVAKHGGRAVSSACGSADVLHALGVNIEMSREAAAEALRRSSVTFLFAPLYHEVMKKVAPLRRRLGVRTVFNLAGPLANPVRVRRQIVGVDRPERVAVVAGALEALGAERALVFSNEAGGDELLPFGSTVVAEVIAGERMRTFRVTSADFGLSDAEPEHLGGGDAPANASILRRILDGESGSARETVLMNASAALVVAGKAGDFRDGMALAARAIDSGAARRALLALASVSQAGPA